MSDTDTGITKIDAARRQLVTAVRLYLDGGDPVSVYQLAANAWEIVDALSQHRGVEIMSTRIRADIPERKDLRLHFVNKPNRNFFKHADDDPDARSPVPSEKDVSGLLFLAAHDYLELEERAPIEVQVYLVWWLTVTERLGFPGVGRFPSVWSMLSPALATQPRNEQLAAGRAAIAAALADAEVMSDPKTEPPDFGYA